MKMSDPTSGGGEEPNFQSKPYEDDPMNGGCKEPPSEKRERESLLTQQPNLEVSP